MMHQCLDLAGVNNVCTIDINYPKINAETLIGWNPEMIIMWNDSPALFYDKSELSSIQAVRNKEIYNLDPMFFYNPHTFKSLCVATAINGWAYPDSSFNAEQEVKDIILTLYGDKVGNELNKKYTLSKKI